MCGLAGFWGPPGRPAEELRRIASAMANALDRRGPDGDGAWCDPGRGIALGHRRLSILDLSELGRQPMTSGCGRYVLSYNGEIYNHAELRKELEAGGIRFLGDADTEVLVEAIARWGLRETLERANGMFAFAIWDAAEGRLTLTRDRLGIKPLYYGVSSGTVLFGSELKALRRHPSFECRIDPDAVTLLLRHNYIAAPHCIYHGFHKLEPGHLAVFRRPGEPEVSCWWSAREVAAAGLDSPLRIDAETAADRLESLLGDAVAQRRLADVPVGAFLSGGIDSSLVVALAQERSTTAIPTFTIGFQETGHSEAPHAARIAKHLGTRHTEFCVGPEDALDVIPELPRIWDEPFADSSQIPTYLVARLARTDVTVALSGDGGDELFGGYQRYTRGERLARLFGWSPRPARRIAARFLETVSPRMRRLGGRFGHRLHRLAQLLSFDDDQELYHGLVSHWARPATLVPGATEPHTAFHDLSLRRDLPDLFERMTYLDSVTYLPGDILTKVDRASMSVGLEVRVPLLDHRIFEFAWRLPRGLRRGKRLLRTVLARNVPPRLWDRPKQGFALPLGPWLRGPLRPWAEELLCERRLRSEGIFDPVPIRRAWERHLGGESMHYLVWDVLMFQAWFAAHGATRTEGA